LQTRPSTYTQLTNTTIWPNGGNISADGNYVAFVSGADFTGSNPNHGQKLFLLHVPTNTVTQISNSGPGDVY
jgi:Tol biopolymer transport system component